MTKDPAVLFYYQDFLVGTNFMSDDEVGKYIRILCHLADKQFLTEKQVLSICKTSAISENILSKLSIDENGNYFNQRMRDEQEKRRKFTESRRNNALGKKAYALHMEDENENINTVLSFNLKEEFESIWKQYPNRQGKKNAERHFSATVKSDKALEEIKSALANYLKCDRVKKGYIQNGSTWFNDWQSWINPTQQMMGNANGHDSRISPATARATFRHTEQSVDDNLALLESLRERDKSGHTGIGSYPVPTGKSRDVPENKIVT